MEFDVFVSHSSKNKSIADAVTAGLESRGIRCWIAPRDIIPGEDYAKQIVDAIQNAKIFVLIFSKEANHSNFVLKEVERAVSHGITIIPFRIEDFMPTDSMELYISSSHWLDAITPDMDDHIQKLGRVISSMLDDDIEFQCQQSIPKALPKSKKKYGYIFLLVVFVIVGAIGIKYWKPKSNLIIESIKIDNRIAISKNIFKEIIKSLYYLEYKMQRQSRFDLRSIYYHEETILPEKFSIKIKEEISKYITYLNEKIEKLNKKNKMLNKYDEIEMATQFFNYLIGEIPDSDLTADQQKEKLSSFFNSEIKKTKAEIKKIRNTIIFKKKYLIKVQILNKDSIDHLISNKASIRVQGQRFVLFRTKQPASYEKFLSVPVSSNVSTEESYAQEDYKIIKHGKINTLWYDSRERKIDCSLSHEYEFIMSTKTNKVVEHKILCTEEKS